MPIELPTAWLVTLNVLCMPMIQLGLAWRFIRLPASNFHPESFLCRTRRWEHHGAIYQRLFTIKTWKKRLPDGVSILGRGFPLKTMHGRDAQFLRDFSRETCRGELAHWWMILCTPVFFLWNPWWADLIMICYAIFSNVPCILAQRYNRARLALILAHHRPE